MEQQVAKYTLLDSKKVHSLVGPQNSHHSWIFKPILNIGLPGSTLVSLGQIHCIAVVGDNHTLAKHSCIAQKTSLKAEKDHLTFLCQLRQYLIRVYK